MNGLRWLPGLLLALAVVAGAGFWLQRQAAAGLREEIGLLRDERRDVAALRAERERLVALQVPAAELAALRADRAAVGQLREEIEKLHDNLQARERSLTEQAPKADNRGRTDKAAPTGPQLALPIGVGADGNLSLDGGQADGDSLRRTLANLPPGSRFEIQLLMPPAADAGSFEASKRNIEGLLKAANEIAAERGLKMSLRLEPPRKG